MRTGLRHIRRFARDEDGATLVEFAIVTCIFFFLFFGLIDFARIGYASIMAEKATERAVRMATVRAPVCALVPELNIRPDGAVAGLDLPNGTLCIDEVGLCLDPGTISCTGQAGHATTDAIWVQVAGLLPAHAGPQNLRFSYSYDAHLNRLGAPYTPVVTVELADLDLDYISPLGALISAAGASTHSDLGGSYVFQSMSASLPAETIR